VVAWAVDGACEEQARVLGLPGGRTTHVGGEQASVPSSLAWRGRLKTLARINNETAFWRSKDGTSQQASTGKADFPTGRRII